MAARAALCVPGAALSLYALYVERARARDPGYCARWDLAEAVSCTRVIASRWGHGLGLVEPLLGWDSAASVPSGAVGVVFCLLQGVLGPVRGRGASAVLLASSVASALASLWLAAILAFVMHDLCPVCLSTYGLNLLLLRLNLRRWRQRPQTD
ncbi:vitamin K epoxide reductase complex subunit 1-like [Lathamus discolor]|uniref:vitamin K epoxide reductase complex subunit 1-like n=1 Tax=Lathamus discolor TaxID=678569 RepID=UPI0032B70DDD